MPALLAYRELLLETAAEAVTVPDASLRLGLLLDLSREGDGEGIEDFRRQVLASAAALGEKYRFDAPHARKVAEIAVQLFDQLRAEHGLSDRHRLLLEVAALLHDIGNYVNIRGHHKHTWYLLSVSDIFGLVPGRHGGGGQRGALPPPRLPLEVPPALHGPRPRRAHRRQQDVRDPAPGQRPRRRPPAEGEGRPPASPRRATGCSRWRARAT